MKRNSKVMSIVAIAVCVVALSVGFAAFSNTLTISSGAAVKPNASDFSLTFSKEAESVVTGELTPTIVEHEGILDDISGSAVTITEGSTTLSGLKANFSNSGGGVLYEFYIHNTGKYTAYLNGINFKNALNSDNFKKCTPKESTSNPLVDAQCEQIKVYLNFPSGIFSSLDGSMTDEEIDKQVSDFLKDNPDLSEGERASIFLAKLEPGQSVSVTFNIHNNTYGSNLSDEEFTVEFGDIEFLFESVD